MLRLELFLLAALASAAGIWLICRSGMAKYLPDRMDKPHAMHASVVPRIGGAVMVLAAAAVLLLDWHNQSVDAQLICVLLTALMLSCVSLIDDRRNLSPAIRLLAHVVAALLIVAMVILPVTPSAGTALPMPATKLLVGAALVLTIVWMTNLYNFMDGANGLAGLMGVIGFGSLALAAQFALPQAASWPLITVCCVIAGSCLGFLFFNLPVARVFMGDAGSIPLGFLAATLGLYGVLAAIWPWWFPVLVFSPFIVDASVTLAGRIVRRERLWEAHRRHYYHRLILGLGWTHLKTALAYATVMLLAGGSGLLILFLSPVTGRYNNPSGDVAGALLIGAWVITYALLLMDMERRFAKQKTK